MYIELVKIQLAEVSVYFRSMAKISYDSKTIP